MSGYRLITLAKVKNGNFVVDNDSLYNFLQNEEFKGKSFVIVSIAGVSRSGKSFIMNFFLKYLRKQGWKNKNWLDDNPSIITQDFPWKRGEDACTQGITVWSEVFTVPLEDESEACVILVDTQGLFDVDTAPDMNMKLMSLSTLFSSHQILNLMRDIDERDLDHLKLCIECSKAALNTGDQKKHFQSLTFLIRDWQNDDNFGDNKVGYLKRFFDKKSKSTEVQELKNSIPGAFDNVECTLLPEPGKDVKTAKDGKMLTLKEVDKDFLKHTADFVDRILNPKNLVVKRGKDGKRETTNGLLNLLSAVSNAFKVGQIPTADTIMKSLEKSKNTKALGQSVAAYKSAMREVCHEMLTTETLRSHHTRELDAAAKQLQASIGCNDCASMARVLEQMEHECNDAFESFQRINDDKKRERNLEIRDLVNECAAVYTDKLKQISPNVDEASFDSSHQCYYNDAIAKFESEASQYVGKMKDEIDKLKWELEDTMESCHTYVKGTWKDRHLAQNSQRRETVEDYLEKLVREFENKMYEVAADCRDRSDEIRELKNGYVERYERKMASNEQKDTQKLEEKIDTLVNRGVKLNGDNVRQAEGRYRKLGRKYARFFEDKLHETMDNASLKKRIIHQSRKKFEKQLMCDEEYKALPDWGKEIAKEPLRESCKRLEEENARNKAHRNAEVSSWERFKETLLFYFRKIFPKFVD